MKTFDEIFKNAEAELTKADVPEPDLNAWYLLAWCVAIDDYESGIGDDSRTLKNDDDVTIVMDIAKRMPDRAWFMLHKNDIVKKSIAETFIRLIGYRKKRVPLEYIIRYTEFMGLPFYVNPSVLIPRQDTECVVERALDILKNDFPEGGADVLDMCTGSGCIAISIKKLGEAASVTATDKSIEALKTAGVNARINDVKIELLQGDMWEAIKPGAKKVSCEVKDAKHDLKKEDTGFDLIISNPPYIRRAVIETLMEEVCDYEPVMALDGGEDGLVFYKSIIAEIGTFLRNGGSLVFEIGYDQGEAVASLMRENGFKDIQIKKDYAGCDRVVSGRHRG